MAKAYYWNPRVTPTANAPWRMHFKRATSGGTVFNSNTVTTATNDLFTDTFVANDALYFGMAVATGGRDGRKWRDLWFNASGGGGLNMAGTYTGVWEYYTGSAWATLTVTDGTTDFTTITGGEVSVTFTPPNDWTPVAVNSVNGFWVRYRLSAVTTATEGGKLSSTVHMGTNTVFWTGDTVGTDDVTMDNLYQQDVTNGWGVITPLDTTQTVGHRSYLLSAHLSCGVPSGLLNNVAGTSITAKAGFFNDSNFDLIFRKYLWFLASHASSITQFGIEQTANELGGRGVNIRYNYGTAFRMDYDFLGTCLFYGLIMILVQNDTTYPTSPVFSAASFYFSSTSLASEYINCSLQGLNFVDLGSSTSGIKKHIYFLDCNQPQLGGGGTISDVTSSKCINGFGLFTFAGDQTITNLSVSGNISRAIGTYDWDYVCDVINSIIPTVGGSPNQISWGNSDAGKIRVRFTVDIHVQDEAGNAIPNATVAMKPDSTAPVTTLEESNNFSVATSAAGDITQQTLTTIKYVSSNPSGSTTTTTTSTYGPFIMTVSKSGFKTMRLRKLAVISATYGLKGVNMTVTLPRENLNLAPEVISLS